MQDDAAVNFLARGYGLVLGLALGASVASTPQMWRDVVTSACWMGAIEVGQGSTAQCPSSDRLALSDGPVNLATVGTPALLP